ncbi:MAG TPA: ABC transporter permease [Planctomycetia bacterium]|nr:ABC transporter permease [Planctomycetia bacterium]
MSGTNRARRDDYPWQSLLLIGLLAVEIAVFSAIGTNFFTLDNFFQVPRLNVELGLLALALTPVIVTGGIDLSVGALAGLAAVLFGMMTNVYGVPILPAAIATLILAAAGGGLNALVITRLKIPALIVTLGTMSLFRGLAEGMTEGVANYTNFPASFLFFGQGYLAGGVPAQLPVFLLFAGAIWLLLHRSIIGRSLVAIGFSPVGARFAGIPVARRAHHKRTGRRSSR